MNKVTRKKDENRYEKLKNIKLNFGLKEVCKN